LSVNTSYPFTKTGLLYLLLERNRAIAYGTSEANRFLCKSSRIQKWQKFSESDRRRILNDVWD